MRFFETVNHRVKDEDQIEEILYLITGEHYTDEMFDRQRETLLPGIKEEVFPIDWERFVTTDRVGAMRLYRSLTNCSLMEAKEKVYERSEYANGN